ncbi:MAG: hypothetical protein RIS38_144 [Verrucomicrobiota bacterium]|jgi:hypothetical protein
MNTPIASLFAQMSADEAAGLGAVIAGLGVGIMFFLLALVVVAIVAKWKINTKAGQPGWACLIPFYNIYVELLIAGMSPLWMLSLLCFFVYPVTWIIQQVKTAQRFGQGTGFALGLIFLNPIFLLILAFGSAQYVGDKPAQA